MAERRAAAPRRLDMRALAWRARAAIGRAQPCFSFCLVCGESARTLARLAGTACRPGGRPQRILASLYRGRGRPAAHANGSASARVAPAWRARLLAAALVQAVRVGGAPPPRVRDFCGRAGRGLRARAPPPPREPVLTRAGHVGRPGPVPFCNPRYTRAPSRACKRHAVGSMAPWPRLGCETRKSARGASPLRRHVGVVVQVGGSCVSIAGPQIGRVPSSRRPPLHGAGPRRPADARRRTGRRGSSARRRLRGHRGASASATHLGAQEDRARGAPAVGLAGRGCVANRWTFGRAFPPGPRHAST